MKSIKVALGIVRDSDGRLLIGKRQAHQFKPGFWELPGGKIETNESAQEAIVRELQEELGIQVTQLHFYQNRIQHYADRQVALEVYVIDTYEGTPKGAEGQKIAWVSMDALKHYKLLPSMQTLMTALSLPSTYWISPCEQHQSTVWIDQLKQRLASGVKLIQLRSKTKLPVDFIQDVYEKCQQYQAKLLLNTINKSFQEPYCNGWHLTSRELCQFDTRPCSDNQLLGASTHNLSEAIRAQNLGVDFVVLSPVKATLTHPEATPLGWQATEQMLNQINMPVYLLGGMSMQDLEKSTQIGAQGIAAVRGF